MRNKIKRSFKRKGIEMGGNKTSTILSARRWFVVPHFQLTYHENI